MRKFNRTTTVLSGILDAKFPIDNNITLSIELFGMQGNEFRKIIPTIKMTDICTTLINNTFYKSVSEISNFPSPSKDLCPIPVEHYTVTDYRPELPEKNFMLSYALKQSKVIVHFYRNQIYLLTVVFYIVTE